MRKLNFLFVILLTGFVFNACEKDSNSQEQDDCLLYGTWELAYIDEGNGVCQYACNSLNSLPSSCVNTDNYGSCLTVTINNDGSLIGTDGSTNASGTWTSDCSANSLASATMADGEQFLGSINSISSNEVRIESDGDIYVFEK